MIEFRRNLTKTRETLREKMFQAHVFPGIFSASNCQAKSKNWTKVGDLKSRVRCEERARNVEIEAVSCKFKLY